MAATPVAVPKPTQKPPEPLPEPEPKPPWVWPLESNHGIRVDKGGLGWFQARRGPKRKHSGIDLSAEVGTPVRAVCDGYYRTQTKKPYGHYVQLVCPIPLGGYVSALYAHLSQFEQVASEYTQVVAGTVVGYVGKSGNASGKTIKPHLHLEMLVHESLEAARGETHALWDKLQEGEVHRSLESSLEGCVARGEYGFRAGHKFDPVLLLACLTEIPPEEPPGREFAEHYKF